MKKLLSLLSVVTITGTSLPTTIAASNYEKEKAQLTNLNRNKRQIDQPRLQDIITTVNIGFINKINKKNIIERLSNINNPILSRPEFLNNIVFDTTTINYATVHTSHNVLDFIPSSIIFTINYVAPQINLNNLIINTNLIHNDEHRIISNSSRNIIDALLRTNPDIDLNAEDLEVSNISITNATIRSNLINYQGEVNVTFRATSYSLITWIEQLNLGTIENNRALTIYNQFIRLNRVLSNELILYNLNLEIINITNNSAQIRIEDNYSSSPDIENPTDDNIIESGEENFIFDFNDIITVTFNAENIYLSSILQNKNLGLLQDNNLKTIITRILQINPHYQLTVDGLINIVEHRITINTHFGTGTITLINNNENLIFNFTFVIPFSNLNTMEWQGFFGQILCRVIISVLYWC